MAELVSATETVFGHRTQSATPQRPRAARRVPTECIRSRHPNVTIGGTGDPTRSGRTRFCHRDGFRPSHAICQHHSVRGPRDACQQNAYGLVAPRSQLGALEARPDGHARAHVGHHPASIGLNCDNWAATACALCCVRAHTNASDLIATTCSHLGRRRDRRTNS
jgi:hypothetical protein